jgi:hypothetical protein
MAQAQAHYQSQKENEAKAKQHAGKTWKSNYYLEKG